MMRCMRMHVLEQWEIFHNIRMHLPAKNIHCKIKMQRDIHLYSPLIFNSGKLLSRFPLIRLQIYFHFTPSPETPPLNFHRNLIRPFVLPRRTSKLWERSASMMKRNTNAKCQRNFDSPFVQKYYTQHSCVCSLCCIECCEVNMMKGKFVKGKDATSMLDHSFI